MAQYSAFAHCGRAVLFSILMLVANVTAVTAQDNSKSGVSARPAAQKPRQPTVTTIGSEEDKREANDKVVTILGTGRQTGHTQFAEEISNVIEGVSGEAQRVLPVLGKSENASVLDVLRIKGIDMAIVDRDVLINFKKQYEGRYGDVGQRINYITKLYNTALHVYAHTDIKSLEHLRGKKISCLKEGSTVAVMCETVFRVFKIDVQIVYDDFELALKKVKTGEIAAAATGATPPIPGFERVKPEDNLHFVPISAESLPNSDFKTIWATYLPIRLEHADYPNMIPQGGEVPTIATTTLLATYAWPPGSPGEQRTRRFVRLFFDNIEAFHQSPRHPKWKDVNLATEVGGWTRYPAAQEWLDSMRVATQANRVVASTNEGKIKANFARFLEEYTRVNGAPTEAQTKSMYALFVKWWETIKKQQTQ
jgi:TRAP-type uncharacterized transport system substrate-binding protein